MIKAEGLTELLKLVLYSDHIKLKSKEAVLSAMIKAKVESGKTSYIEQFNNNDGMLVITDSTAWGILRRHSKELMKGEVRRIIIPDFINVTTRSFQTVNNWLNFLKDFISPDGVREVNTYAMYLRPKQPIKGGLLTTMAHQDFERFKGQMAQQGFLSRLLLITYEYSREAAKQILLDIANDRYDWGDVKIEFPSEPQEVAMPGRLAERLIPLAEYIGDKLAGYGFRAEHQFKMLCKCSALSEGRDIVKSSDVAKIADLAVAYLGTDSDKDGKDVKIVGIDGKVQLTFDDILVRDKAKGQIALPTTKEEFDQAEPPACYEPGQCAVRAQGKPLCWEGLKPSCEPLGVAF